MIEFDVIGNKYRAGKLNAFQQLHVTRRLAPVLPKLLPAFLAISTSGGDFNALAQALEPAAQALADMSDADCEYVYHTCLSVVSRQQGNAFSSVFNASNRALMFDDVDLSVMTQLVIKVLADSLAPFIQGILANVQSTQTPA